MADIPNKARSLEEQVQALEIILHGLQQLVLDTDDPDDADTIRLKMARVRETFFVKQSQLNAVRAMSVVPPVSDQEKQAVLDALAALDRFVIADQQAHEALDFLVQVADRISNS